jgi:hypothetical protein
LGLYFTTNLLGRVGHAPVKKLPSLALHLTELNEMNENK